MMASIDFLSSILDLRSSLLFSFFSEQAQGLSRRPIGDRKKYRVFAVFVFVVVKLPRRYDEDVAFRPIEFIG